jgi:hypothetical protein
MRLNPGVSGSPYKNILKTSSRNKRLSFRKALVLGGFFSLFLPVPTLSQGFSKGNRNCPARTETQCRDKFENTAEAKSCITEELKLCINDGGATVPDSGRNEPPRSDKLGPPSAAAANVAAGGAQKGQDKLDHYRTEILGLDSVEKEKRRLAKEAQTRNEERLGSRSGLNPEEKTIAEKTAKDRQLLNEAESRFKQKRPIPDAIIDRVSDRDVRENLLLATVFRDEKESLKEESSKISKQVAELMAMAAANMQNFRNLESVKPEKLISVTKQSDEQGNRDLRSAESTRPNGKAGISEKAEELALDGAEKVDGLEASDDLDVALSPEARAKLKAGIEAAAKRKKALSLKEKLRAKVDGKAKDTDSTEKLFSGDLIPDSSDTAMGGSAEFSDSGRDENSSSASSRSYNESPVFQAMQAMQNNGFSMDSSQTEAEVSRMLAEAKDELGDSDRVGGILEFDSPSLFARVKTAHSSCLKRSCVQVSSL